MKRALVATALAALVGTGFALWLAARTAPPTASVSRPEPPQANETDYLRAVYSPLHFRPAIETADDAQCLACHREVIEDKVRAASPSGLRAQALRAAYQQTSTYVGEQETFHRRHLVTPLAKRLMNLRCNTCHQGHDPREEAQGASADSVQQDDDGFTLRKQVNPQTTCLKCHGRFPWQLMGLPGPWETYKDAFGGSCLGCHATVRSRRHEVSYLNADEIERADRESADACYGCHGGRAWYRIAYPYPRTPWPGMPTEVPAWAKNRSSHATARTPERAEEGHP